ncbi:MAG: hypothetical protein SXG53_12405 [Pseudomonadota bacterium]|nr:hypothetical protein [Pseudomonadota bacterium]
MQTSIAAFAAAVEGGPAWMKNTARAAVALFVIKSALWLGASWLAFRGFGAL